MNWKDDWEETKHHFVDWWNQDGLLLYLWDLPEEKELHEAAQYPGEARDIEFFYTQPAWRARWNHYRLSRQYYPADTYPVAETNIGPGSLALFLGSEANLSDDTVWFEPCIDSEDPDGHPPLRFDPDSRWWRITEETLQACANLAKGKYVVGFPDLIENIDIVASLRRPQLLMLDMLDRPDWVIEKVWEVNEAFFVAYDRIYDIIKLEDGSISWDAFRIWGPGKTAKVQCDTSAMFSPEMFSEFVVPALTAQCEWLDYSMFHLDGHQCIQHLDLLLEIDPLDAIEWTPDPQVPSGGNPKWYAMYRNILEAGKSVQAIGVNVDEVEPLLDAVGGKGMYIQVSEVYAEENVEHLLRIVEPYR